jgi:YVTN family beta-propeller protein
VAGSLLAGCSGDGGLGGGAGGPSKATDAADGNAGTATTAAPTMMTAPPVESASKRLQPFATVAGDISPKSVVASGHGEVFAQNMIYSHTVTVYDQHGELLSTIPDAVDLAAFGITDYPAGEVQGGPVEMAFTPDGTKAYVSNYSMYGPGFDRPGDDVCSPSTGVDDSFVYRIDVASLQIDQVIEVGAVPKYVATSPDGRWVLVTNWCSYDLSVIDAEAGREVQRIPLGEYPRGIVVDPTSSTAYVAIMGETRLVAVDLAGGFATRDVPEVGGGPRHLVISPDGRYLYVTLNRDGQVAKVDIATGMVIARIATGSAPRSMDIAADGASLYVVNYESNTVSKVLTADMSVIQDVPVGTHPIGITYDRSTGRVWVACYSGTIEIFDDA